MQCPGDSATAFFVGRWLATTKSRTFCSPNNHCRPGFEERRIAFASMLAYVGRWLVEESAERMRRSET